ncbi:hypothetical protein COU60_02070 [Candidatus Pacearchaeota archaeon CG10_big_fil_rev_8_21_14_0_10_34_76]|nr:MAG: hypothetical protein COU60_02070 [Candidatus Pacearchaeota archaeon CG10_big_fil_rev_8_21_14_0_10_34_76]
MKKRVNEKRMSLGRKRKFIWAGLRILLGAVFLWAFFDKLLGLGFSTTFEKAWVNGGSPTYGFLTSSVRGPFADFFGALAGQVWVDWVFMFGLLLIGLALVLGVLVNFASLFGGIMMFLMWIAVFPPKTNPFVDDHLIYILVLAGISVVHAGRYFGFGTWWHNLSVVRKYKWLE